MSAARVRHLGRSQQSHGPIDFYFVILDQAVIVAYYTGWVKIYPLRKKYSVYLAQF